jgi:hypothetical protein
MVYYLGNPYRHEDPSVEDERILKTTQAAGTLIRYGIKTGAMLNILAPVLQNYHIDRTNKFTPEEMNCVLNLDLTLLAKSDGMIVLTLDGWEDSTGLKLEIDFCKQNNKPIYYLSFDEIISESEKLGALIH